MKFVVISDGDVETFDSLDEAVVCFKQKCADHRLTQDDMRPAWAWDSITSESIRNYLDYTAQIGAWPLALLALDVASFDVHGKWPDQILKQMMVSILSRSVKGMTIYK